ncbi:hypothetical protein ISCGN_024080 [Ixodes scapularis]
MNFSILESEDFIEETRRALERLSEGSADAVFWENFKHAPEAAEEEERSPGAFGDDIKYCREQLLTVLEERYRGAQVRSRTDVLEGLFRKEVVDTDAFEPLLRGSSSVPEEAIDVISCPIRKSEVRDAIGKLSRNKAPGPDGIGAEFYKAFSDTLCPILTEVFADTKKRGLLPPTMRQSRTVLIPKKSGGGSVPEIGDFRPISLLCADYKILAKIFTRRLDIGVKTVIRPYQSYTLRGRKISRNLHTMRAIGEVTAEGHQPLAVLQLDLKQAFDRVSHDFLLTAPGPMRSGRGAPRMGGYMLQRHHHASIEYYSERKERTQKPFRGPDSSFNVLRYLALCCNLVKTN